jgi:hypothetical protein
MEDSVTYRSKLNDIPATFVLIFSSGLSLFLICILKKLVGGSEFDCLYSTFLQIEELVFSALDRGANSFEFFLIVNSIGSYLVGSDPFKPFCGVSLLVVVLQSLQERYFQFSRAEPTLHHSSGCDGLPKF